MWQVNLTFNNEQEKEIIFSKVSLLNISGIWEKDGELEIYFENQEDLNTFKELVNDSTILFNKVSEKINWLTKWQKLHKIIRITPFLIVPPFLENKTILKSPYAYKIIINPSFAFGTGNHPTTKMCIKYLIKCISKDAKVLDMGTGSGILAIVAEKLGAKHIVGIDIDEIALKEAKKNIKVNNCENIEISTALNTKIHNSFDIIVCNILYNDIISLKDTFSKVIKKEGYLILSGLLKEQTKSVIKHYICHFSFKNALNMKDKNFEWTALLFKKI